MDMCAALPVIVHHECGDPSAHGYLLDCLRQTVRCNENTVLLGSTNWKPLLPEGVAFADARALEDSRLAEFERVYVDLAPYYPNSLIFFRRLFLMETYLRRNGLHEAVLLDSDILLYQDLTDFPRRIPRVCAGLPTAASPTGRWTLWTIFLPFCRTATKITWTVCG